MVNTLPTQPQAQELGPMHRRTAQLGKALASRPAQSLHPSPLQATHAHTWRRASTPLHIAGTAQCKPGSSPQHGKGMLWVPCASCARSPRRVHPASPRNQGPAPHGHQRHAPPAQCRQPPLCLRLVLAEAARSHDDKVVGACATCPTHTDGRQSRPLDAFPTSLQPPHSCVAWHGHMMLHSRPWMITIGLCLHAAGCRAVRQTAPDQARPPTPHTRTMPSV